MQYEIAHSNIHNCTNPNDHVFGLIDDKEEIKEIRRQHTKMKYALWKCVHCGKITQST